MFFLPLSFIYSEKQKQKISTITKTTANGFFLLKVHFNEWLDLTVWFSQIFYPPVVRKSRLWSLLHILTLTVVKQITHHKSLGFVQMILKINSVNCLLSSFSENNLLLNNQKSDPFYISTENKRRCQTISYNLSTVTLTCRLTHIKLSAETGGDRRMGEKSV